MLVTPFKKHKAYQFGFIDQNGKRIKLKWLTGKRSRITLNQKWRDIFIYTIT